MPRNLAYPIRVRANTHHPSGRPVVMDRTVEGRFCDVETAAMRALRSRKDRGYHFYGCEVTAEDPHGNIMRWVLDPDSGSLESEGK